MEYTLKDHGDIIELNNAEFIIEKLPSYNAIWTTYIGNDGRANLPPISNFTDEQQKKREKTNQYIYTALESTICMKRACEYFINRTDLLIDEGTTSYEDYIRDIETLNSFWLHLGKVRDSFSKLGDVWGDKRFASKFQNQYERRSNTLHEAKLPTAYIDGLILVAKPGAGDENKVWKKNSKWTDLNINDLVEVTDLLQNILDESIVLQEGHLASANTQWIKNELKQNNSIFVEIEKSEQINYSDSNNPGSGSLLST